MRPIALAARLTEEERLAHEAFVASLGEEALWRGVLTSLSSMGRGLG
jgi:DNA polymerase-3 subunit epsilon